MWPQTLQMSKDECRMTLRRLELESYGNVIGVLRAQGGLTDRKARLLEELRSIFHISQDRHRAEARRVANDEQLSTIAEIISGPNTWQEWSREGRRTFPLLPRVAPQTALGIIANKLAAEASSENAKLPYPAETGKAAAREQAEANVIAQETDPARQHGIAEHYRNYLVKDDPFKMPDIPAGPRKYQKRNAVDTSFGGNKKRHLQNDNHFAIPTKNLTPQEQQLYQQQLSHSKQNYQHHITGSPHTSPIGPGFAGNKKTLQSPYFNNKLQQQRYFHYQQQKAKKLAKAPKKRETLGPLIIDGKPKSRAGRKPKKVKEMEEQQRLLQQKQQMEQQQQQHQQQQLELEMQAQQLADVESERFHQMHHQHQQHQSQTTLQLQQQQQIQYQQESFAENYCEFKDTVQQVATIMTSMPQIAASKKDATRIQNKLQLPGRASGVANTRFDSTNIVGAHQPVTIVQPELSTVTGPAGAPIILAPSNKATTTPVQKYIVEDRQPQGQSLSNALTSHQLPVGAFLQAPNSLSPTAAQYMTLPTFSAAANKLRGVNTTILPQGAKVAATKKLQPSILSLGGGGVGGNSAASGNTNQTATVTIIENPSGSSNNNNSAAAQLFSIIDGTNVTGSSTNLPATLIQSAQQSTITGPSHAPPAIIQLQQSNENNSSMHQHINVSTTGSLVTTGTQGKVLTTKILPIILSSNAVNSVGNANVTTQSTSVSAGVPSSQANILGGTIVNSSLSTNNTATSPVGATILKGLTPSILLASGSNVNTVSGTVNPGNLISSNSGSVIPSLVGSSASPTNSVGNTGASTTTIFRKQPNILKSSNRLPSSNKPQIISNIRLAPAFTTPPTSTTITVTNQQQHNQQEQNAYQSPATRQILPATSLRANVKICQSPNGKVFLQPTNPDGSNRSGIAKLQGTSTIHHRILTNPSSLSATSSIAGNVLTKSPATVPGASQRFQIQKVQIIPASGSGQTGRIQGTTLTLSGNNNSIATGGVKNNMTILSTATGAGAGLSRTSGTPITLTKHGLSGNFINTASVSGSNRNILTKPNVVVINTSKAQAQLLRTPTRVNTTGKIGTVGTLSTTSLSAVTSHNASVGARTAGNHTLLSVASRSLPTVTTLDNNQMITEDTPVDIIVSDDDSIVGRGDVNVSASINPEKSMSSNVPSTDVTVLESNVIDNNNVRNVKISRSRKQSSALVPDVTDWEMELDQAAQQRSDSSEKRRNPEKQQERQHHQQMQEDAGIQEESESIVIDDSFEDVIIEEHYEENASIDGNNVITLSDKNIAINPEENDVAVLDDREPQKRQRQFKENRGEVKAAFKQSATLDESSLNRNVVEISAGTFNEKHERKLSELTTNTLRLPRTSERHISTTDTESQDSEQNVSKDQYRGDSSEELDNLNSIDYKISEIAERNLDRVILNESKSRLVSATSTDSLNKMEEDESESTTDISKSPNVTSIFSMKTSGSADIPSSSASSLNVDVVTHSTITSDKLEKVMSSDTAAAFNETN